MRSRKEAAVPDDVLAAADEAELGEYEWTWRGRRSLLNRLPAPVIRVFDAGLVVHAPRNDRLDVYPWAVCHLTYRCESGRFGTKLYVTIAHEDGLILRIRGGESVVDPILEQVTAGVTAAQLPRAWAVLDSGERLDFGRVQVDLRYLHHRDRPIPWSQVAGVRCSRGSVTIKRKGKILPYVILPSDTSDFHVLQEIAEALWRGRAGSSTSLRRTDLQ